MSEENHAPTPVLEVVFARIADGSHSVVRFDLGTEAENAACALRHGWNNRMTVVKTSQVPHE